MYSFNTYAANMKGVACSVETTENYKHLWNSPQLYKTF